MGFLEGRNLGGFLGVPCFPKVQDQMGVYATNLKSMVDYDWSRFCPILSCMRSERMSASLYRETWIENVLHRKLLNRQRHARGVRVCTSIRGWVIDNTAQSVQKNGACFSFRSFPFHPSCWPALVPLVIHMSSA